MQKIEESIEQNNTKQLNLLQPANTWPPVLYQYTSVDAMLSILKTGKLWVSGVEQLNDKAELRYSVSIFRAHVDRHFAIEKTAKGIELFQHIRRQLDTLDTDGIFIASFSADGDEPGMWQLYGDRGKGFSFAFPLYKVEHWGGFPGKCHYDPTNADEFCISALRTVRDALLGEVGAGLTPNVESLAASFLWRISYFGLLFKPHAWADEKEWRLIFMNPNTEVKVRSNGSKYIEIPNADRLPIGAICAGPLCEAASIKKLQLCIDELGLRIPLHLASAAN